MPEARFTPFPVLSTENLILRQLTIEDENEIFALRSNLDASKFLDRPIAESIDDARQFINKISDGIKNDKWIFWVITPKGQQKLAGTIGLWNFNEDKTFAEIGYELLPAYQGKGIMQEGITRIIKYSFETLKLQTIEAEVAQGNLKSVKVLERNRFKKTEKIIECNNENGTLKMLIYELENQTKTVQ